MKTIKSGLPFFLAAAILPGAWSCSEKIEEPVAEATLTVSAEKNYSVAAASSEAITFTVQSANASWEILSEQTGWCTIEPASGEAGEEYTVTVICDENTGIDRRTAVLTVACGSREVKINVIQEGTAFLEVDRASLEFGIPGGDGKLQIHANQPWSTEITSGSEWLTIEEGFIGENDGTISLTASANDELERTAILSIRDRNGVEVVSVPVVQKGLSLDLSETTFNVGYEDGQISVDVSTEIEWSVRKGSDADIWYSLSVNDTPAESETGEAVTCTGSGKVTVGYSENLGGTSREAKFVVYAVLPEGSSPLEREVTVIQALNPDAESAERHYFNEEGSIWRTGQGTPIIGSDGSVTFESGDRLIADNMPLGRYTFSIRHTGTAYSNFYCIFPGEGAANEIRWHMNAETGMTSISTTPWNAYTNVAFDSTKTNLISLELGEAADGSLTVKWILNGTEFSSLASTANIPRARPGAPMSLYIGMSGGEGTVVYEWYEYTPLE